MTTLRTRCLLLCLCLGCFSSVAMAKPPDSVSWPAGQSTQNRPSPFYSARQIHHLSRQQPPRTMTLHGFRPLTASRNTTQSRKQGPSGDTLGGYIAGSVLAVLFVIFEAYSISQALQQPDDGVNNIMGLIFPGLATIVLTSVTLAHLRHGGRLSPGIGFALAVTGGFFAFHMARSAYNLRRYPLGRSRRRKAQPPPPSLQHLPTETLLRQQL